MRTGLTGSTIKNPEVKIKLDIIERYPKKPILIFQNINIAYRVLRPLRIRYVTDYVSLRIVPFKNHNKIPKQETALKWHF